MTASRPRRHRDRLGEAVRLEDGSFRGAALNVAAAPVRPRPRRRGDRQRGDLAGSRAGSGLHFSDRGRVQLKNIADPIHILTGVLGARRATPNRWVRA